MPSILALEPADSPLQAVVLRMRTESLPPSRSNRSRHCTTWEPSCLELCHIGPLAYPRIRHHPDKWCSVVIVYIASRHHTDYYLDKSGGEMKVTKNARPTAFRAVTVLAVGVAIALMAPTAAMACSIEKPCHAYSEWNMPNSGEELHGVEAEMTWLTSTWESGYTQYVLAAEVPNGSSEWITAGIQETSHGQSFFVKGPGNSHYWSEVGGALATVSVARESGATWCGELVGTSDRLCFSNQGYTTKKVRTGTLLYGPGGDLYQLASAPSMEWTNEEWHKDWGPPSASRPTCSGNQPPFIIRCPIPSGDWNGGVPGSIDAET